jgi:hypothetical protein
LGIERAGVGLNAGFGSPNFAKSARTGFQGARGKPA